jgi:hypothetical protein
VRTRARTDKGHKAIVQALRQVGCKVTDLSRVGCGCPDILVRHQRYGWSPVRDGWEITLMEIKEPKGKLTPDQEQFIAEWPETVIVRSVQEALAAVGVR